MRGSFAATFVDLWLASDEAEAPVLLTGSEATSLQAFVHTLSKRENVELVALPPEGKTLTIDQVRELFRTLQKKPLVQRRLVVIPRAERLTVPAAQALLKSLEEPALTTRYLLTTSYARRLPPTIVSRCSRLRLSDGSTTPAREAAATDELGQLADLLRKQLRRDGPSRELLAAFMRLRDYYHITSLRGNEKLAREVLFASLPRNST